MNKHQLHACRDILKLSMDLNEVVSAACKLDDENKQLKAENKELRELLARYGKVDPLTRDDKLESTDFDICKEAEVKDG